VVSTTSGGTTTQRGVLAGSYANGDTLTALVDATGTVYVWKTSGASTTYLGSVALPNVAVWTTGSGRIGMQLPVAGVRGDNFAGGNVP
jgi:hypothetical protein